VKDRENTPLHGLARHGPLWRWVGVRTGSVLGKFRSGRREWGTPGVGQSSWGPAVYGILEGEASAARLAERLREALGPGGVVYEGPFRSDGARVWRAQVEGA